MKGEKWGRGKWRDRGKDNRRALCCPRLPKRQLLWWRFGRREFTEERCQQQWWGGERSKTGNRYKVNSVHSLHSCHHGYSMIHPLCQHQSCHDISRAMLTGPVILFTWCLTPLQLWLPSGQWSRIFAFHVHRPRSILMHLPQFPCLNVLIVYQAPIQLVRPLSTTFESKYIFPRGYFSFSKVDDQVKW